MTVRAALQMGKTALDNAGIPDAGHDAGALLAHLMGVDRLALFLNGEESLTPEQENAYTDRIARRAAREPLQYIIGHQAFMGLALAVRPGVLIPREDTAVVVEQALQRLPQGGTLVDVGTGSGAIAIAIRAARPDATVCAVDISPDAVSLARDNARACGTAVEIVSGDLLAPFHGRRFDVIVSNPPYIPAGELPGLQPEVRREPALALDGGADGLAVYRRLLMDAPGYLTPGGSILLELGDGLAGHVKQLAERDFCDVQVYHDLGGLPRALAGRLKDAALSTNQEHTQTICR